MDQGFGLDNTLGVAGFPSGEAYKVGKKEPYLRLPRAFVRQTLDMGEERETVDGAANQLRGSRSIDRWVFTVGKFGAGSLVSLGKLLACFYVTCLIFVFAVLWPIARWCGFSIVRLIGYIREELLVAFATTSSETVLPQLMVKLENLGCQESVVGLVIPAGYSFNLDGTCLYLATAAVFLAQATNTPLDLWHQLGLLAVMLLSSKGAAGVAGAAFVVLAATIASAGTIPVASVALVLGIHRLMSQGLTPTNVVGNAVATVVIAKWEHALDEGRLHRVLEKDSGRSSPVPAP